MPKLTSERYPQPNASHDHIFVVLRLDVPLDAIVPSEFLSAATSYITATKAFVTEKEAEARRLNTINSNKDCRYYVTVARLLRTEK